MLSVKEAQYRKVLIGEEGQGWLLDVITIAGPFALVEIIAMKDLKKGALQLIELELVRFIDDPEGFRNL